MVPTESTPRKSRTLVIAAAVIVAAGAGIWWFGFRDGGGATGPRYETGTVDRGAITSRVTATGTPPTATPQPTQITVLGYLLALDPQDALVLKNLKDAGALFDVVLRNPLSETEFDLTPVTIDYLIERYNLPLEIQRAP